MTPQQRTAIRSRFNLEKVTSVPVVSIPGSLMPPKLTGKRGGWFTIGGTMIYHPNAYAKKGWSNMTYRCSTRVIYVGANWLRFTNYDS